MAMRARGFEVTYPNAAGVDVGSASHFVAVPPGRDAQTVQEFQSFTADLERLADWLQACGVDTVAMESTGVYWIPLFELLAGRGFQVFLVNARSVRNVSGRKSDVLDCQWLQQLMTFGLLRGAYRPAEAVCALRAVSRHRDSLIKGQAIHVQRMQKALTQMNVQLTQVLSDIVGETGQKILRQLLAGERDPVQLAKLKTKRIRASEQDVARALQGTWRPEHLFALRQALQLFDFYGQQIQECDRELEGMLEGLQKIQGEPAAQPKRRGRAKNAPAFDLRLHLYRMCGVDLTRIDGIDVTTALKVLSEVGADLSRFPSVKAFCSWLGLCPGTHITGGKVIHGHSKRIPNRATLALKQAAAALRTSQSAMGAYYRRLCARMDRAKAITAAAHKLARLIYLMITKGAEYIDRGQEYYEERHRQRVIHHLKKKAASFGLELISLPQPA